MSLENDDPLSGKSPRWTIIYRTLLIFGFIRVCGVEPLEIRNQPYIEVATVNARGRS